jgi:predicted enzyme related to lactoylglutathione lyase
MKDALHWFDIPTQDFDRAVKFYSEILGKEAGIDSYLARIYSE